MAQVTFATAFGHPLGVQKNMTFMFVPYRGAVPPILFDLALVSGFANFRAPEGQIYFSGAQQQSKAGATFATEQAAFHLDAAAIYLEGRLFSVGIFAIVQIRKSARRFFPKKITV